MLYQVHFRRSAHSKKDYVLIEPSLGLNTLEKAKAARSVSGDLVVSWHTHEVIQSEDWLFDWEKADPNCYARKAMSNK